MAEVAATADDKIPATFSDTAPDVEMFPVHKMICESAGVPPPALSEDPPARLLHERKVIEITAKDKASARRTDLLFNSRRLFVLPPYLNV